MATARATYEALASACREIEYGITTVVPDGLDFHVGKGTHDALMELIVARIAWACRKDNPRFDSFKFTAKARGRPE